MYVWRMMQNQDLTSLVPVTSFPAHATYITRVLLSPDSRHLATCSADHNARIWAVTEPGTPPATASSASTAAAAPASAAAGSSSAHASGLTSGPARPALPAELTRPGQERAAGAFALEATLGAHQRWVWDCAFSADSAYLVTASSDHFARLWELGTASIIRQYNGHHRGAVCVALNDYSEAR